MEQFGKNFLYIRNTHVIPLVSYGINKKNIKFWSLKDVITKMSYL